jgi:hypothetical protein
VVAALAKCPHNLRVARENPPEGTFWLAGFYRDDIQPAPAPDEYITYDRNIEGPRGRFGAWSFSGTARDYHDDPRGKLTYVGAMALGPNQSPKWPLNAALHSVGAEVRFKQGDSGANRWSTHLCLARQERNASTTNRDFAAITTSHRLSVYNGPATNWEVTQQWIFTRHRLIGLVSLAAGSKTEAFSIGGAIQLVSGRGGWGVRKEFVQLDANTLKYGAMLVRFHFRGAGEIRTEYTDVFSGDSSKTGRIVLTDRDAGAGVLNYSEGSGIEFMVEIHPDWVQPAKEVRMVQERKGLKGISLEDGELRLQLLHNPSVRSVDFANSNLQARVARSGDQYRAPWLEEGPAARELRNSGNVEQVPPHSHIVLRA